MGKWKDISNWKNFCKQKAKYKNELWEIRVFLRFVINDKDIDSHRLQGLFQSSSELIYSKKMIYEDEYALKNLRVWFSENLEEPTRFARSKNPAADNKAISWFKDSAKEHIQKMRAMAEILERYGVKTKMIKEKRIGYIVYEDEFQVTAVPFKETKA